VIVHLHPVGLALESGRPAHTSGDVWAEVEPDGVVLCGDLWVHGSEPFLADGSLGGSLQALDSMRSTKGTKWLPGHGLAPGSAR
jgi:cyclase